MIDKNQIQLKNSEISANYEYSKITYAGASFDNVLMRNTNVCVLPFETDDSGKTITSLYLRRYYDFTKESMRMSTLIYKNEEDRDETNLDTVLRCMADCMKLHIPDIKRVFYLGEIEMNMLLSGAIPCYGVNVTGLPKTNDGHYVISDSLMITLEKQQYISVLKGTSQDYLIASSVFMLLSYMS